MPIHLVCLILLIVIMGGPFLSEQPPKNPDVSEILPKGFALETPLLSFVDGRGVGGPTIKDKLAELGAHVRDGKIVDRNDKEILFVRINSPARARKLSPQEVEEIRREKRRLEKEYTVVRVEIMNK